MKKAKGDPRLPAVRVIRNIAGMRRQVAAWRKAGERIGFVPTMGFLHEGHATLLREARKGADRVVLSIFVNPTQFGPNEDFEKYPRDDGRDSAIAAAEGVDAIFYPRAKDMYPTETLTRVHVAGLSEGLCGAHRPGHFDGVALVVAKLFNIVQPDRAWFGEKDFQQLAVIRRMVEDLNFPVEIIGVPTVREKDGLAMSSRNVYLGKAERKQALAISKTLKSAQAEVRKRGKDLQALAARLRKTLDESPGVRLEYLEIVDPATLRPADRLDGRAQLIAAARVGSTRLIDNAPLERSR